MLDEKGQVSKDYRYDSFGQEELAPILSFGGNVSKVLWQKEVQTIDNPFRYTYCSNNPIMFTDLSGLSQVLVDAVKK